VEVLVDLVKQGKLKYFGLSECSAETLRRAKAVPGAEKLIAVQVEYSFFSMDMEQPEFIKETGIAVVAYNPLNRGLASGS